MVVGNVVLEGKSCFFGDDMDRVTGGCFLIGFESRVSLTFICQSPFFYCKVIVLIFDSARLRCVLPLFSEIIDLIRYVTNRYKKGQVIE